LPAWTIVPFPETVSWFSAWAAGRHHTAGDEDKFGHVFFGGGKSGL
jgi:hypothetical protein